MEPEVGTPVGPGHLDWLLDDLVRRVPHLTKAVILSQDGITLGASDTLERDDAEHLAALAAGFQSLARGAGRRFGGGTARQIDHRDGVGFPAGQRGGQRNVPGGYHRAGRRPRPGRLRDGPPGQSSGEHIRVNARTVRAARLGLKRRHAVQR